MKHIDYALVPKPHKDIYLLHKFWARKPENIVAEYVSRYSRQGEIVLDPFVGSGVTVVESVRLGRRAVGIDLNPLAVFVTRMTLVPAPIDDIQRAVEWLERKVGSSIMSLYDTRCPKCQAMAVARFTVWRRTKVGERAAKIYFDCPTCRERGYKTLGDADRKLIMGLTQRKIARWFPDTPLYYDGDPFLKKEQSSTVADLFTARNRIALSELLYAIRSLPGGETKNFMLFALSATLPQVSKMIRANGRLGGWTVHSFWLPPEYIERNVWLSFRKRCRDIVRAKEAQPPPPDFSEASDFQALQGGASSLVLCASALDLDRYVEAEAIDYVFTDPPYGDSIQYLELSTLFNSILFPEKLSELMKSRFSPEIVVNPSQRKDKAYYYRMLSAAFRQVQRVLKPNRWMTVTFHNTAIEMWNAIIKAVILAGFDLEKIVYQPPSSEETFNRTLKPYGTPIGDYYLRFVKPAKPRVFVEAGVDNPEFERVVIESAKKIIAERGEPTPFSLILNGIIIELESHGVLLKGERDIKETLQRHVGNEFALVDSVDAQGKVVGHLWWFTEPGLVPYLERIPLYERVEQAVLSILRRGVVVSFDEVLQTVFTSFPNALTPSSKTVKAVIEEYAQRTPDGRWQLKPLVELRFSEHSVAIGWLCEIGKKAGFKTWVGLNEQSHAFKAKPLRNLCDPLKLSGLDPAMLDRVKFIDCLWFKDQVVRFAFEVEVTTSLTEALLRGANIPYSVTRVLIIPEEREKLLSAKLRDPAIREQFTRGQWSIIFLTKLNQFYNNISRHQRIKETEFRAIFQKKYNIDRRGQTGLF